MDEFQKAIIDEMQKINNKLDNFEINVSERFTSLESRINKKFDSVHKEIKSVADQTFILSEFREEVNIKLDVLSSKVEKQDVEIRVIKAVK
ncbi:MAG: hypothetical protein Q7S39_08880 [Ignavibacteria bacterium]|nr:hypothetical protein [Ignavibacteria bacterium]